jgi:predicted Zn-dependent protease
MEPFLRLFASVSGLSFKAIIPRKSKFRALFSTLFFFVLSQISVQAQEGTVATGGEATGNGGSVSYSIGQVIYTTNTGSNGSVAQGIQQAYEISAVTGVTETPGINLILAAYPNPTTDFLNLKVENYDLQNLSYQLYDINGQLLESKKLNAGQTIIVMSDFAAATYILKVTDTNLEVKTFRIIKN